MSVEQWVFILVLVWVQQVGAALGQKLVKIVKKTVATKIVVLVMSAVTTTVVLMMIVDINLVIHYRR